MSGIALFSRSSSLTPKAGGLPTPARVLRENAHLLPATGKALDLACGLGGNALFLARRGLETWAFDFSENAIRYLLALAKGLPLHAEVRDVVRHPPEPSRFDVIVVSRFLERTLAPGLIAALRPGGLLFYQTFVQECVHESGPKNPAFRLEANELLALFSSLRLLVYREEGCTGDVEAGFRDEAYLVAKRWA